MTPTDRAKIRRAAERIRHARCVHCGSPIVVCYPNEGKVIVNGNLERADRFECKVCERIWDE